ncbi:class I adenylate-forming enzyme family protein [Burkholderia sp. D-99]|uniref:class I adenylate-forming enzyme family protein n=1 Tax=Burkholderia sp. D-99 TaxID=2717316 RepID=UPI001421B5D3|nr:AMP-binding protein [Burkholderia sp. D-99]NHV25895.1 long-chain fatty acid--CoA ligase [Burkholderia sp. D-99]
MSQTSIGPADFEGSFTDVLDEAFERFADRECVAFGQRRLTYADVDRTSAQVANALIAAGFEAGMKAAVYSLNSDLAFITTVGIVRGGGVWLPVNPRNSEGDNVDTVVHLGCDVLFYQHQFVNAADAVRARCPGLKAFVVMDSGAEAGRTTLDEWMAGASTRAPDVPLKGTDLVSIPTTGGTTGQPKGVMLSHRNFRALAHASRHDFLAPGAVMLCAAPMTHVGGRLAMTALSSGARLVVLDKVDPQLVLHTIQQERITDVFLPPTAIYSLLDQQNLDSFDLSSLRNVGYGSAPMSIERLREALVRLGPVMRGGFGQTECPMFITAMSPAEHYIDGKIAPDERLGSVGRATSISQVSILDDNGDPLPVRQRGEIAVRGGNVSEGYYGSPEETAAIRCKGWHLTGDVGYLDEEGYLHIVDRRKDMIISGGFNVYSAEVEQALMQLPGVRFAAVIGIPSEKWGEEVKAFVQLAGGCHWTEEAVIEACRQRLGGVKTPKTVEFVDELPFSPIGKLDKKRLRAPYWKDRSRSI